MEEERFKDRLREAMDADPEARKLKKQIWELKEKMSEMNLEKSKVVVKYMDAQNKFADRKLQIQKEVS